MRNQFTTTNVRRLEENVANGLFDAIRQELDLIEAIIDATLGAK